MNFGWYRVFALVFGTILAPQIHAGDFMPGEPLTPYDFEKAARLVEASTGPAVPYGEDSIDMVHPGRPQNSRIDDRRKVYVEHIKPWPKGVVPYMLDNSLTENDRVLIAKAITVFQNISCVRVIARTTEPDYMMIHKPNSTLCDSPVGYTPGKQTMRLGQRCIKSSGTIMHEFMHVLGFFHEMCRIDRDKYVIVHFDNIAKHYWFQFRKIKGTYANDPTNGPYDINSILHYGRTGDAKDKSMDAMTPINGTSETKLGQRTAPTDIDAAKLNKFYNCDSASGDIMDISSNVSGRSSANLTEENRVSINGLIPFQCRDYDSEWCELLDKFNYCEVNPVFMIVFCRRTCGKCGLGCQDANKRCPKWADKNYCAKYSDYMYHFCAKSCRVCII